MTKQPEQLPRPEAELERLAEYYDTHDTSTEMETGGWVEPQPMATTSLRLPVEVIDQLKRQAGARHIRYTSYVRSILERAAHGGTSPEIADITERLERIERAVTERQSPGDQKTALQTQADGWPLPGADRALGLRHHVQAGCHVVGECGDLRAGRGRGLEKVIDEEIRQQIFGGP